MKYLIILLLMPVIVLAEIKSTKLGLVVPLTGSRASIGSDARAGAVLALEDLKNNGISEIELVLEDSQGDPKIGVMAVQKLLGNKIHFVLTQNSNVSLAAKPIIERAGALQMAITTTSDNYSTPNDLSYRTNGNTEGEAREFVAQLAKSQGKVLIATMEDEYPVALRSHIKSLGYNPEISVDFAPTETDFRAILSKAKGFSAVVCLGYQTQCGLLAKQLRQLGNNAMLYVNVPVNNKEFFDTGGAAAEGSRVIYPVPNFQHPAASRFEERYDYPVNFFSSNAYDGVYLLGQAIHQCLPDPSPNCISKKLKAIENYNGLSGHKYLDAATGDMNDNYSVLVAKSGRFVLEN